MKFNDSGDYLLRSFEVGPDLKGPALKAYQDSGGIWTIGLGHTKNVTPSMVISIQDAYLFYKADKDTCCEQIYPLLSHELSDNQFSALVCFVFNLGINSLKTSTLLKKLNDKDYIGASNEFIKWDKFFNHFTQHIEESPGLKRRRIAEENLFLTK